MPKNNFQEYLDDDTEYNEKAVKESKSVTKSNKMQTDYSIPSKDASKRAD